MKVDKSRVCDLEKTLTSKTLTFILRFKSSVISLSFPSIYTFFPIFPQSFILSLSRCVERVEGAEQRVPERDRRVRGQNDQWRLAVSLVQPREFLEHCPVPSHNGISILTRADKRLSRTYRAPRARIQERSRQFPKRDEASRIKNGRSSRMKWQKMVTGRAANSDWQKTKSKKKRAKKRPRRGGRGRRRGRGRTATQGVHRETAKGDEDFVQGSAFRLGRRGRDCPLLWYRAVGLVNF